MSWFLTQKTTKKKKKKVTRKGAKTTASITKPDIDPESMRRGIHAVACVVIVFGVIGGWVFGQRFLQELIAARHEGINRVDLVQAPTWMSSIISDHLRVIVSEKVTDDPFDQQSLKNAANAMAINPWVRHVDRIIRRPGGVIEVRAIYRKPVALIETSEGYHLVDQKGVLLPARYDHRAVAQLRMPVLRGVMLGQPVPGVVWPGGDVQAGLELARHIAPQKWAGQVRAIDVANYSGRSQPGQPHLILLTENGQVRWGRAPGDEQYFEPPAQTKLNHIRNILHSFPTIDAGGRTVDVFGDQVLINSNFEDEHTPVIGYNDPR
ncbi:MAG: cell division protein FtsQ/DivIB [Planctomycetota bacterium]|jgi:hypothetical protein